MASFNDQSPLLPVTAVLPVMLEADLGYWKANHCQHAGTTFVGLAEFHEWDEVSVVGGRTGDATEQKPKV